MSLHIGRVGVDITLTEPAKVAVTGGQLSMSGLSKGLSAADWVTLRDQLIGLNDSRDEPVIPFTSTVLPSLNGFYTNVQTKVDTDPGGYHSGVLNWAFQGDRIPDFANPQIESTLMGGFRPNNLSISAGTTTPWWGCSTLTGAFTGGGFAADTGFANPSSYSRGAGALTNATVVGFATGVTRQTVRWNPGSASVYYSGTCQIEEQRASDSAWRKVVGRQHLSNVLRMSNEVIRVTIGASSGIAALVLEVMGATWQTVATFQLYIQGAGNGFIDPPPAVVIDRNAPECVRIRIDGGLGRFCDVALRPSALHAECYMTSGTYANAGRVTAVGETGASVTGGMRRSADDSNGNRWVLYSPAICTATTASSANLKQTTGSAAWPFMIGAVPAYGGTGNAYADILAQYLAPYSERIAFVTR